MAWSKSKTVAAVSAGILLAGIATLVVWKMKERSARKEDFVAYEIQHQSLTEKLFKKPVDEVALRNQLVGTWEMAAARSWGNPYTFLPKGNHRYKVFTLTNWAIVTLENDLTPVFSAGGGYTLKGNLYTEAIDQATGYMARYKGAHPRFNIRVVGDKYYQMGTGKKPFIEEMWQRAPDVQVPPPPEK